MKVLQINAVINKGSTGRIARDIGECILKKGGNVYFASQEKAKNLCEYTIGNNLDYKLHALFSRVTGMQGYASKIATKQMIKWINEIKPDIIHIHNIHNNYLNLPILFNYIYEKKLKTVITLHDSWFFTGKCTHFLKYDCLKWKEGCKNCIAKKKEVPNYFFDTSSKVWNDRRKYIGDNPMISIVGCSKWISDCAKESVIGKRIVGTIYNGIDTEIFKPTKSLLKENLCIKEKFIILGMANKWLSQENTKTFKEFIKSLKSDEILLLLGCKSTEIEKLPKNVKGIGFVSDRNLLAKYYSIADVFVNVTKVDTFPTVNLEALSCGVPVVAYDSGGTKETINQDIGYIVQYGDTYKLRKSIDLIRSRDKIKLSYKCREHVKKKFNKLMCYDSYIELYNNILKKY